MSIMDIYMFITHLFLTMFVGNQLLLYLPSCSYFLLFAVFEMRLIVILWKQKYMATFTTEQEIRRGLGMFYFKFYGMLIVFLYISYKINLQFNNPAIVMLHLYLIP